MDITSYELLVGTVEEFVLGYRISRKLKQKGEYELTQSFTSRAHNGPVRSLIGVNKFLVSGGSDEICKIFDLVGRVEHGQLMHHEGTVSCLAAHGKTFLLTASDDNSLAVTRVGSWQVEKTLHKHQGGITALAIHPTGKLAFTAAKDRKLITWNLVKGRPAFITNLKGIAEFLVCSPDGARYCVGVHRRVDVYSIESAGVEYTVDLKCRPNCLAFVDDNTIAVGCESSKIQIHSLIEKRMLKEFEAHETRVRCMQLLKPVASGCGEEDGPEAGMPVLATASSADGHLKLWRLDPRPDKEILCIGDVDTTCRVTCMAVWHPGMREGKKKKRKGPPDAIEVTEASELAAEEQVRGASGPIPVQLAAQSSPAPQLGQHPADDATSPPPPKKKKKKSVEVMK